MSQHDVSDQEIEVEVSSELEQAKTFLQQLDLEDVRSGEWFVKLLKVVMRAYNRNARAEYFEQKYPGLTEDEIADKLISVTVRYAAIAGAVAGVTTTMNQITTLASGGFTAALLVSSVGAEMVYLSHIQIRLILDMSVIYDLQLDANDPEDILMIFGYALGIAPTELAGKGLQIAAGSTTKSAIKSYISKGTLKSIQDVARRLGFKILQRTIIKYMVPAVSAAVGSSYNYMSTLSVGRIARTHFKNRGKVTDELRQLISKQNTYELLFPAAARYIAEVDGDYSAKERELYQAILSRMSFDPHTRKEFDKLIRDEANLLNMLDTINDPESAQTMLELLILMAVYDGELVEAEEAFLLKTAAVLQLPIDLEALRERAQEYQIDVHDGVWRKVATRTGEAFQSVGGHAQQVGQSVAQSLQATREKGMGLFRQLRSKTKEDHVDEE